MFCRCCCLPACCCTSLLWQKLSLDLSIAGQFHYVLLGATVGLEPSSTLSLGFSKFLLQAVGESAHRKVCTISQTFLYDIRTHLTLHLYYCRGCLRDQKFHYSAQKSRSFDRILSHLHPIHAFTHHIFQIFMLILSFSLRLGLQKWSLPLRSDLIQLFPTQVQFPPTGVMSVL